MDKDMSDFGKLVGWCRSLKRKTSNRDKEIYQQCLKEATQLFQTLTANGCNTRTFNEYVREFKIITQ